MPKFALIYAGSSIRLSQPGSRFLTVFAVDEAKGAKKGSRKTWDRNSTRMSGCQLVLRDGTTEQKWDGMVGGYSVSFQFELLMNFKWP